jgi:hypothetical protein
MSERVENTYIRCAQKRRKLFSIIKILHDYNWIYYIYRCITWILAITIYIK